MEALIGDLGLVERVLPVTESHPTRTYYTQYHLTDNFFRFWFRFIEPNQGHIEFGDVERITDLILARLPDYMGLPFEAMCRDWVRLASAAGALAQRVGRVGTWWNPTINSISWAWTRKGAPPSWARPSGTPNPSTTRSWNAIWDMCVP